MSEGPAPVIVVGMHRSGTSALARVLNLLGVDLGPGDQLMEPREDNPDGFWENRLLVQIHDDLIARMGGRWDDPPLLDELTSLGDFDEWVERCADVVREFEGDRPGFKDPRASLLLELWQAVWPRARVIVSIRHPAAVAASLRKREDFDDEKTAQLWLRYTWEALSTAGGPTVVRFEDLLGDAEGTVETLTSSVGLSPTSDARSRAVASIRGGGPKQPPEMDTPASPAMESAVWLYQNLEEIPGLLYPLIADGAREPATLDRLRRVEDDLRKVVRQGDELHSELKKTQGDWKNVRAEADRLSLLAESRLAALEREEHARETMAADLRAAEHELKDLREEVAWRRAIQYRMEKVLGRGGLRFLSGKREQS